MRATRRRLLIGTALSGSFAMMGGCAMGGEVPPHVTANPGHYFTPAERAFIDAAVGRLIPPGPDSPGGREAGVAEFIDRQMAGDFGRATRWYMQGPWAEGTDEQGYQMAWTPCEVYRHAIDAIARHCDDTLGKSFTVVSRIWWKFSSDVLRASGFGPDQAARSRLIGAMG